MGIFVTLNPGYAGRSNLPDSLKKLFRGVAMVAPDKELIVQVMLFAQSIANAESLAKKIVTLFSLCMERLSKQLHYDFGLRAMKSVLVGAGELKRACMSTQTTNTDSAQSFEQVEESVLVTSVCHSILTKLVAADVVVFKVLLREAFPGASLPEMENAALVEAIEEVCREEGLQGSNNGQNQVWVDKVLQLRRVLEMRHGVILVGEAGTGKSTAWRVLFKALSRLEHSAQTANNNTNSSRREPPSEFYIIDPKAVSKEQLFGRLDAHTLEWEDGVFTHILRRASTHYYSSTSEDDSTTQQEATVDGRDSTHAAPARVWVIFDGDVDPLWAESLNSVLDDNRLFTLPSGDRLRIPPSMRIILEVSSLQHATMATISRCGMLWFQAETVPTMVLLNYGVPSSARQVDDLRPTMGEGQPLAGIYGLKTALVTRRASQGL